MNASLKFFKIRQAGVANTRAMCYILTMRTSLILIAALVLCGNTAWSDTKTFKLSVTIPETVTLAQNNLSQTVQIQRAVRNNQTISLKSIVVH